MPRIDIILPEKNLFTAELVVRANDINYGGHVGNDSILTLIQEARIQFYRHLGFRDEMSFEGNVGQIITDAAVIYKSESFMGDILTIKIGTTELARHGFDMFYLIENKVSGKEIARAKTGIVCFDYATRKVASIPTSLSRALQG
jgi:YbgC/YbaW family acyl-CoA thioester hydrolase